MTALTAMTENPRTFIPQTMEEQEKYARYIAATDLVPQAYKNKPDSIVVAITAGAELGFKPLHSLKRIAVVNGNPTIWGDALPALMKMHDGRNHLEEGFEYDENGDAVLAWCIAHRYETMLACKKDGFEYKPTKYIFTKKMAEKANLWGKNTWAKYPERMLQMRARGYAVRDNFADVMSGLYVTEEMLDVKHANGSRFADADIEDINLDNSPAAIENQAKKEQKQENAGVVTVEEVIEHNDAQPVDEAEEADIYTEEYVDEKIEDYVVDPFSSREDIMLNLTSLFKAMPKEKQDLYKEKFSNAKNAIQQPQAEPVEG
ncbi:MAG: hypothetical protein ACK5LE_04455 [Alphaproteobacteria bacterium]